MIDVFKPPQLLTPGRLAAELGVPLHRVLYVLATRQHIRPRARAGTLRLYTRADIGRIREELADMDAQRKGGKCESSTTHR